MLSMQAILDVNYIKSIIQSHGIDEANRQFYKLCNIRKLVYCETIVLVNHILKTT